MAGSVDLIRKYYHLQRSNQLGSIIAQVDKICELAIVQLAASFTAVLYRRQGAEVLVPVGLQRERSSRVTELKLLEDMWAAPPEGRGESAALQVDALDDNFRTQAGIRDEFAAGNSFRSRLCLPLVQDGEVIALLVAYWVAQHRPIDRSTERSLHLLLESLVGTMSMSDQLQQVNEFSVRLGEALSMFDLRMDEFDFRDLVSQVARQARVAIPAEGVCLLARKSNSDSFKVSEFFDSQPVRPQFTGDVAAEATKRLDSEDDNPPGRCRRIDMSAVFEEDCSGLVALEIRPDRLHQFVLAVWTHRPTGFTSVDLELLSVFSVLAQTLLRTGLLVRRLRRSKRVLEKSSERMADTEALAAVSDMTSGVAHDFNNVLGGIIGRVQLMKLKTEDESIRTGLEKIELLAMEGAETVRCIQEFTSHTKYKEPESVDLRELVHSCALSRDAIWRTPADDKKISVIADITVDEAFIEGCRADLFIALDKLIENAVEHSPDKSEIRLVLTSDEKRHYVTVADSGTGIPEAIRKKIFYPFFSTKESRGAGLGLAVVHGIVTRHGGQIALDPEAADGTVFKLSFNRAVGMREDSDITRKIHLDTRLSILVVDDDEQIREILSDMLTIDGHVATACPDGYSALEAVDGQTFDLIITDLGMPGMSGLDLAAVVHEKHPDIPIAMITGWGTQLEPEEVSLKGVKTVLPKPFHLRDVKALVKDLVVR